MIDKDYPKNQNKQTIWAKPIYIHVMPQLRRKVPNKTFVVMVSTLSLVSVLIFVYFFVK